MRLWHKDLIPVLPRKQLLGQWRECCAIAKNIAEKGTPNHVLVNRIMDYPLTHFVYYTGLIYDELVKRGYSVSWVKFNKNTEPLKWGDVLHTVCMKNLFMNWHNDRYLLQCFFNLQEKYDCGGLTDEEYHELLNYMIVKKGFKV